MITKTFSRQNLDFTLFDVLNITDLAQHDYFSAHDADTFNFTLDAATDIADKILRPIYVNSDRNQPELVNGQVKAHPGIHDFFKAFAEAGFIAAPFSEELGGMQLPKTIMASIEFILGSAHNSAVMYVDLSTGVGNLIASFGSEAQKTQYLPKLLSGQWAGTMCLTETQAGSSLSDVATSATPLPDGSYKIKGQKIFISAGDHDVTENIVHLVLARIDGAPKGTKGISLFIVPKNRENTEGGQLSSNDVVSIGIYHKMGQKATPAMHLEFGEKDDCIGYLLGEANRGLPHMFLMMNGARLGVGMTGLYLTSVAYYTSLQYAQERPQGRRLHEKSVLGEQVTIIHHPDVRRMLFLQKAILEGGLAFVLQCYKYLDLEKANKNNPSVAKHYSTLLELLTPVAKTYGAEMGCVSVSQGLQVLGGYGYTEDFELEQMARDVRIMPLYEGTTGIQSQALLGRQILGSKGETLALWIKEVKKDVENAKNSPELKAYWSKLVNEMRQLQKVTDHLLAVSAEGDTEVTLSDANLYMEAFGILNVAWLWLKQGIVAEKTLSDKTRTGDAALFYVSKIETMQFYFHYEVPRLKGLFTRLMDKKVLTIFKVHKEVLM
jgi:alkylation response protein AidB-like acyl-CoA dehydrogenase